jgi:LTXXQ motif family protein
MMGQGGQGGGMMGHGQGGMMGHGQGGMMGRGGMMGGCPKMGGMMGGGMMGKGMMQSRPMMEARLAYIKADLEITDAQTAAWNAYADAVRTHYGAMATAREAMSKAMQSGKILERMDARIQATQAKLDSLKALKPATEELFKVLTDEQQKKADQLLGAACRTM